MSFAELAGLSPAETFVEAGYLNLTMNHGLLYTIAYLVAAIIAGVRLFRLAQAGNGRPGNEVYWGSVLFLISFSVGMWNLPLERIFPNNLLLVLCLILGEGGGPATHGVPLHKSLSGEGLGARPGDDSDYVRARS